MKHTDDTVVSDEQVLNYHLMHPGGNSVPGDPNLAYFLDGVYHLHYILQHPWKDARSFSFIHVTSPDMLHWTWQPTKLQPSFTDHGMFSGTGFITKDGRPAAIYAGLSEPRNSFIAVAADDRLIRWEIPYPIVAEANLDANAKDETVSLLGDPDCFLVDDTYYAYSAADNLRLFKSHDLQTWIHIGSFLHHDMPDVALGEDISCANFFRLGDKWMLLCISHSMGCRYYLGEWDVAAEQFVPELHGRMNWRRPGQSLLDPVYRDYFAPESVLTPDGRRVMWAWLCTLDPEIDLKSVQSLPRELSLDDDGRLRIRPLRELEFLRYDGVMFSDIDVNPSRPEGEAEKSAGKIAELDGYSIEMRVRIDRDEAERRRFGLRLFAGTGSEGFMILFRPESGTICIGETEAPFAVADLPAGEDVELRIYIDKYLVEVFINDRQAAVGAFMGYLDGGVDLIAYNYGGKETGPMRIRSVEIWKLEPTNQGFFEALKSRNWAPDID